MPHKIKPIAITVSILVILCMVYGFILIYLLPKLCFAFTGEFPSIPLYIFVIALLMAILYFVITKIMMKKGRREIIHSIQVFLVFSVFLHLLPGTWRYIHFFHGAAGAILICIAMFVPEISAFIGLVLIKKKNKIASVALMIAAIIFAVEIIPLRMVFFYGTSDGLFGNHADSKRMLPFGKEDREYEFLRSMDIIKNLSRTLKEPNSEALEKVIICVPNFEEYPDILKLVPRKSEDYSTEKYLHMMKHGFKEKEFLLNTTIDTDNDGLTDFKEAQLLSDAYNPDTDGDGIIDGEDTDPLNRYIETDYADINTKILQSFEDGFDTSTIYLIENSFYKGHGEFANFDRHVVILCFDQAFRWSIIFDWQNLNKTDVRRCYFKQGVSLGRYVMDITRRLAIVGVVLSHGGGASSGLVFLLIKLSDEWCILAINPIWG